MQPFYLWIIRSNKKQATPCEHKAAVIYEKNFTIALEITPKTIHQVVYSKLISKVSYFLKKIELLWAKYPFFYDI